MGHFGIWAPGVLPFPVVVPLKDKIIEDPAARYALEALEEERAEVERQAAALEAERARVAARAGYLRADQEFEQARRKKERVDTDNAAWLAEFSRVLADPTAPLDVRRHAAGIIAGFEAQMAAYARERANGVVFDSAEQRFADEGVRAYEAACAAFDADEARGR